MFKQNYSVHSAGRPSMTNRDDTSSQRKELTDSSSSISLCQPEDRITHLRSMCSRYKKRHEKRYKKEGFMYVSEKYKYLACVPHKAGSSSWEAILVNNSVEEPLPADFRVHTSMGGRKKVWELNGLQVKRLSGYNITTRNRILKDYYKFMVVRHPLDRLLSCYMDKIVGNNKEFLTQITKIRRMQLERYGTEQVDFPSFLEIILEVKLNSHWTPASVLCDPCNVKYDKIVKLETFKEDLVEVLPHLGPYNRAEEIHRNQKGSVAATSFFKYLPAYRNVDENLFKEIMAMGFDRDMELFGYSMSNRSSSPGIKVMCSSDKLKCC